MVGQVVDFNGAAGQDRTVDLSLTKKAVQPERRRNPSFLLRLIPPKSAFVRAYVSHTCPMPHAERLAFARSLTVHERPRWRWPRRWWGIA